MSLFLCYWPSLVDVLTKSVSSMKEGIPTDPISVFDSLASPGVMLNPLPDPLLAASYENLPKLQ